MLRRIGRVARTGLFLIGIMLLLWLPPSFYFWAHAQLAPPRRMFTYALVGNGRIGITWADTLSQGFEIGVYRPDEAVEELGLRGLVLPELAATTLLGYSL